jgi:hypothetical protein
MSTSQVQIQNRLDAITRAVLAGETPDVPEDHLQDYVWLVGQLHDSLTPQEPSARFLVALRDDLMDEAPGMVHRLRAVPARVHIATITAAILAGIMWIARRKDNQEDGQPVEILA